MSKNNNLCLCDADDETDYDSDDCDDYDKYRYIHTHIDTRPDVIDYVISSITAKYTDIVVLSKSSDVVLLKNASGIYICVSVVKDDGKEIYVLTLVEKSIKNIVDLFENDYHIMVPVPADVDIKRKTSIDEEDLSSYKWDIDVLLESL